MSQLNVYVPKNIENEIRNRAKKEGKSISSFITDIFKKQFLVKKNKSTLSDCVGKWKGDFPKIKRPIPDDIESL